MFSIKYQYQIMRELKQPYFCYHVCTALHHLHQRNNFKNVAYLFCNQTWIIQTQFNISTMYFVNGIYLSKPNKCDIWFLTVYLIRIFYRFYFDGELSTNFSIISKNSASVINVIHVIDLISHAFISYTVTIDVDGIINRLNYFMCV